MDDVCEHFITHIILIIIINYLVLIIIYIQIVFITTSQAGPAGWLGWAGRQPGGPIIIINIGLAQAGLSSKVYKNMYVKLFCVSR